MKKFYVTIADYCLVIQGILMVLAIAVGAVLTMLVGFYTVVATGWFWTIVYTIALLPVITDAAKKDQLKDMLFSPTVKTQLLAACVFVICLCILTIGVFL